MTITVSQQAADDLCQATEATVQVDPSEPLGMTYLYPAVLGHGHTRCIELRPGLTIKIFQARLRDRILMQCSECFCWLEYHFHLRGQHADKQVKVGDRFLTGFEAYDLEYTNNSYFGQLDLLGRFNTGSISHQFLVGFDVNRQIGDYQGFNNTTDLPDLDIFDPDYDISEVELNLTGEILPGWNVTASYAYTDAEVTEDNATPVGNRLANVPENQVSLWTTYTIQDGGLRGLGFGLGLFYVGEREGDLANSFELEDYLRTDAAIYYRRGRFNGAINIRNLFDIEYANSSLQTFY